MANNKRTYEAILVLDTQGSEDSADALTSKVSEIIASMGGEVKKVENLGFRLVEIPGWSFTQFYFKMYLKKLMLSHFGGPILILANVSLYQKLFYFWARLPRTSEGLVFASAMMTIFWR